MLDTNIVIRCLMNDNPEMAHTAARLIKENDTYISNEVIAEVVYVLNKVYSQTRSKTAELIMDFIESVFCSDRALIYYALDTFAGTNLDFVDCILYASNKLRGIEIATFDKQLQKMLSR